MKPYFAAILTLILLAATAQADPRPWTFTYDLYPEGKGNLEYEQWITWSHHTKNESGFDRVEFRHEIEWGVADNFGLYGEINVGPHFAEFEQKLLVQKDIGPWSFAYNLVFETEIERERDEVTGERENQV